MGLDLKYFKNQMHINDLYNLNENELKFIIPLLQDGLDEFNINDGLKSSGLFKACKKSMDLFQDFNFILCGYIDVINKNDLSFYDKTKTEQLINIINTTVNKLKLIITVTDKLSKNKFDDLLDFCLLNMRVFYDMMNDYITDEYNIWKAVKSREEKINKRECYMNQDKFNTNE